MEATSNSFWDSGLGPDHTVSTLKDYWPGENNMGKILSHIRDEILEAETMDGDNTLVDESVEGTTDNKKQKASSPLFEGSMKTKHDG